MKMKNIMIAVAAFVVGAAAGWFASGVANSPVDGPDRARCPRCADADGVGCATIPDVGSSAAKTKHKAPLLSAESEWTSPVEQPVEKIERECRRQGC